MKESHGLTPGRLRPEKRLSLPYRVLRLSESRDMVDRYQRVVIEDRVRVGMKRRNGYFKASWALVLRANC